MSKSESNVNINNENNSSNINLNNSSNNIFSKKYRDEILLKMKSEQVFLLKT